MYFSDGLENKYATREEILGRLTTSKMPDLVYDDSLARISIKESRETRLAI